MKDYAVKYWINLGAPPHKLVLGLGLYGRSFTLSSSSNTIVGAPAAGAGIAGTYTGEAGLLASYEVHHFTDMRVYVNLYVFRDLFPVNGFSRCAIT